MKKAFAVFLAVLMLVLLASCRTTVPQADPEIDVFVPEPSPAPLPEILPDPEPVPEPSPEPSPESEPVDPQPSDPEPSASAWSIGETGPDGGLVFECDGLFLETGEPIYEAGTFDDASALVQEPYRLPEIEELVRLFLDLVEPGLLDIEWTYYWSGTEVDADSVIVMNFDTGFEGRFYRDMDFVSVIPVRELH